MRIKLLVLIALLTVGTFITGCMNIQADEGARKAIQACHSKALKSGFEPVVAVTKMRERSRESAEIARALIRHDDGDYYIVNMERATARKVSGIAPATKQDPCKP